MTIAMKKILVFAATMFASSFAMADDSVQLMKILGSKNSLFATFESHTTNNKGTLVSQQTGTLKLKKPDHFMMHTLTPDETVLYTKDLAVVYYDSFVNQATLFLKKDLYTSPFMLLNSQDKKLWSLYKVKSSGKCYNLTPIKDKTLKNISLCFENGNVNELTLNMADGNVTVYKLSEQNKTLTDSDFKYTIPSDAQIDDQR